MTSALRFTTAGVAAMTVSVTDAASSAKACTEVPRNQWLSLDTLQRKVEMTGFGVRKAELEGSCAKFDVTAKTGDRLVLLVDPATGTIVDGR
jgi:hypothetical protein